MKYLKFISAIPIIKCQKQNLIITEDVKSNVLMNIGIIDSPCENNNDCYDSSYCCSKGKCSIGIMCSLGLKLKNDTCDFKYECANRCCNHLKCQDPRECQETCYQNKDCTYTTCCSNKLCTQDIVCEGNKINGDSCDAASECATNYCQNGKCSSIGYHDDYIDFAIRIIAAMIIVIAIILYCLSKMQPKVDNYQPEGTQKSKTKSHKDKTPTVYVNEVQVKPQVQKKPIIRKLKNSIDRGLHFNKNRAYKTSRTQIEQDENGLSVKSEATDQHQLMYLNQGQNLSLISEMEFSQEEHDSKAEESSNFQNSIQNPGSNEEDESDDQFQVASNSDSYNSSQAENIIQQSARLGANVKGSWTPRIQTSTQQQE